MIPQPKGNKSDLREARFWSAPSNLQGHIFYFGRIGSGKTCKLLTTVQAYHALGYKIWDIFGGKRGEGPFWTLPNDDDALWKQLETETAEFLESGPKQYRVRLLYPMFASRLPSELPQNLPHVTSKIFTIPFHDVEEEDVTLVLGTLGPKAKTVWDEIKRLPKSASGPDIQFLMDTKFRKRKNEAIYTLFIKPALEERFLSNQKSELVMDWIAEAEDRETVTVLCLDYVPERFKLFLMGYLQRKIFTYAIEDKIHKRNIGLYREASAFMKVQDTDKSKEDTVQIFRNQIVNIARYGRSGFFLAMDTQDSSEVKGMIEGCLPGDTLIKVFDGVLRDAPISDLPERFSVLSYNFEKQISEIKPAKKTDTGVQDCFKLVFENGASVVATAEHKFFNPAGEEVTVSQLREGDKILFVTDGLYPRKLIAIENIGSQQTFDIEVEDNHNFVLSNNVLSHNSEDILGICEMPSPTSREVTCAPLKRDRRMNEAQIRYIATMPIHQICLVTRGNQAVILKRIQPPRCKYFKSQYGNFYSLWRKEVNAWTGTAGTIQKIEDEYRRADELLLPKRAKLKASKADTDEENEDDEFMEDIEEESLQEQGGEPNVNEPALEERPELTFNSDFG